MIDRIDRKREVLVHVAKYCFEGTLEAHKEFIPLEIVPHGSQPTHRCCVYREREVLRNRVDWACGRASVYDGENHYTFTDQPVAVMNSACEGCPCSATPSPATASIAWRSAACKPAASARLP